MDLLEEVLEDDPFLALPDGRYVVPVSALAGRAFTHRLTAEEAAGGSIPLLPDLEALVAPVEEALPLAGGGEARILVPDEAGDDVLLAGPAGWLGAAAPGDLIVLRWAGGAVSVAPGEADAAESDRLATVLAAALRGCVGSPDEGALLFDVVLCAVADDAGAFARPPAPLGELLAAAGLERRGEWVGEAGREWLTPVEAAALARRRSLEVAYDFSACCQEALRTVQLGFLRHLAGEAVDAPDLLDALAHGEVAEAFGREAVAGGGEPGLAEVLGEFGEAAAGLARGRQAAPPRYLIALAHEACGRAPAAEAALGEALAADPRYAPALSEAATYAEERGDAGRAAELLRRAGAPADDPELERLERHAPERSRVPRNAPCPCGSGRKHKACCLGRGLALAERVGWLYEKALAFAHRPEQRPLVIDLAGRLAASDGDPEPEELLRALVDPLVADLALFEGGLLRRFLRSHGALLPADERDLAGRWCDRPRALVEVIEAEPGAGLRLRDTRTGEATWVRERLGSHGRAPGELMLARIVPAGEGHQLVGPVLEVSLRRREALLELTAGPADPWDWIDWLRAERAPPRVTNMEGEETVLCEARYRVGDPASARARLAAALEADEDGTAFREYVELRGERWLRGTVRAEGDELVVEANSTERIARLTGLVSELLPDAALIEERRTPLQDALAEHAAGAGAGHQRPDEPLPPEARAALEDHLARYADRWVDEPVPALGGLTPRQARDDPTRREDLVALLRELEHHEQEAAETGSVGMPIARIRRALGLEGG